MGDAAIGLAIGVAAIVAIRVVRARASRPPAAPTGADRTPIDTKATITVGPAHARTVATHTRDHR